MRRAAATPRGIAPHHTFTHPPTSISPNAAASHPTRRRAPRGVFGLGGISVREASLAREASLVREALGSGRLMGPPGIFGLGGISVREASVVRETFRSGKLWGPQGLWVRGHPCPHVPNSLPRQPQSPHNDGLNDSPHTHGRAFTMKPLHMAREGTAGRDARGPSGCPARARFAPCESLLPLVLL